MVEETIKNTISAVLREEKLTLHKIILFGSRARGDFDEESDYDILVIVNEELPLHKKRELAVKITNALHKEMKFTAFDIIVKSLRVFEEEKNIVNTISYEARREGLYL